MEEVVDADYVYVMENGKIIMDGTPKEIFARVDLLHSIGLEAPQGVELIHLLNSSGMDIDEGVLSVEECTEALYNYLSKE